MRSPNEGTAILLYDLAMGKEGSCPCLARIFDAHNVETLDEFRSFLQQVVARLQPNDPDENVGPVVGDQWDGGGNPPGEN